jgi:uncharacterized protein (UPF0335 family)
MSTAPDVLKTFVDRIERLNEEIKGLNGDKSDLYAEAKSAGFDAKALKIVIGRRAKDSDALLELDAIVETYEAALGTPVATRAGVSGLSETLAQAKAVSARSTTANMAEHAKVSQALADAGMISQEAADENKTIAAGIARKFGVPADYPDLPPILDRRARA